MANERCDWCKTGEEKCGTCRMFFDFYGDGGSDRCSADCDDIKCAYYKPVSFCPHCGTKLDDKDSDLLFADMEEIIDA